MKTTISVAPRGSITEIVIENKHAWIDLSGIKTLALIPDIIANCDISYCLALKGRGVTSTITNRLDHAYCWILAAQDKDSSFGSFRE